MLDAAARRSSPSAAWTRASRRSPTAPAWGSATVFRRFPTKQDLIVAVIEARIARCAPSSRGRGITPIPGRSVVAAMEALARLQARDRGLFEAIGGRVASDAHLQARHAELHAVVEEIVQRGQDAGVLRADVEAIDLPLLAAAAAGTGQFASVTAPDLWRRYLGIMLDGLRPEGATPIRQRPLTLAEMIAAKATMGR